MTEVSYFHQPLTNPMEHRTLVQLLESRAIEHPDKEAIVIYNESRKRSSLTFGEYQTQSRALAASLIEKGLGHGDRVAIMSPNKLEYVISMMACLRIGANVINIVQGLSSDDIAEILTALKCNALICFVDEDPTISKVASIAIHDIFTIHKPKEHLPHFREVITIGSLVECERSRDHIHLYSELLSTGHTLEKENLTKSEKEVQFDDDAFLLLTSGSDGVPKAVQYTHQGLVISSITSGQIMKATSDSRIYNDSPFTWPSGICCGLGLAPSFGSTIISIPPVTTVRDRSMKFFLSVLENEKCTNASLIPYHLFDIVAEGTSLRQYNLKHFQYAVIGGQPVPKALVNRMLSLLPNVKLNLYYATTEFMIIAEQLIHKKNIHTTQYGWMTLQPGVETKIVNEEGHILPVGSIGEVHVRGPMLFAEYLENPYATRKSLSATGWFNSSEMGEMNNKGEIKIYGHKGDAINRAADVLYPVEWEKVMVQHPLVAQVKIIGVPDPRLYEEMCACVVLKEHNDLESKRAMLEDWYNLQWPRNEDGLSWKPGYTIFLKSFPMTRTNSPDRRELRKLALLKLGLKEQ